MQPGCEGRRVLHIVFACMLQEGIDYRDGQTEMGLAVAAYYGLLQPGR